MKRKILKLFTIITVTLLLLFVVPPFINWVVSTDWGIGFITPENKDTWINFYGAVIGGGITLGGVAWTIYDQNKIRRVDLSMQYKPIIILNPLKGKNTFSQNKDGTYNIYANIINIGRAEAKDVELSAKGGDIYKCSIIPTNVENINRIYMIKKDWLDENKTIKITFTTTYTDIIKLQTYTLTTIVEVEIIDNIIKSVHFNNNYK